MVSIASRVSQKVLSGVFTPSIITVEGKDKFDAFFEELKIMIPQELIYHSTFFNALNIGFISTTFNVELFDELKQSSKIKSITYDHEVSLPERNMFPRLDTMRTSGVLGGQLRQGLQNIKSQINYQTPGKFIMKPGYHTINKAFELMEGPLALQKGYDGSKTKVCILDSGVLDAHRMLIGNPIWTGVSLTGVTESIDKSGHGTACSTIVRGKEIVLADGTKLKGFTNCQLGVVKCLYTPMGMGRDSDILEGFRLALEVFGAKILSCSWGGTEGTEDSLNDPRCAVIRGFTKLKKIFYGAVGNAGPAARTVGAPWDEECAVTIGSGSIMDGGKPSWYTSRGPTNDGRVKPDAIGYGGGRSSKDARPIEMLVFGSTGYIDLMSGNHIPNQIGEGMGSSFANPEAAAIGALQNDQLQASGSELTSELIKKALKATYGQKNNDSGYGVYKYSIINKI